MPEKSYKELLEQLELEARSGGGFIGKVKYMLGYKAYQPGVSPEDDFFPMKSFGEKEVEQARVDATEARHSAGVGGNVGPHYCLLLYQDSVKGNGRARADGWNGDQYFVDGLGKLIYRDNIKPWLDENDVHHNDTFWCRVMRMEDPNGRTKKDQDGNEVLRWVAYITEKYANEAEAQAAADAESGGASSVSLGTSGISEKYHDDVRNDYEKLITDGVKPPKAIREVAEEWSFSEEDVEKVVSPA